MRTMKAAIASLALLVGAGAIAGEAQEGQGASGTGAGSAGGAGPGVPSQTRDVPDAAQGTGSGQEKDPAAKAATEPQLQSVVGTVVELKDDALTVKSSPLSDPHEVKLGQETRFTREGESISRDQIREGDQVRATFSGGTATEVSVIRQGEGTGQGAGGGGAGGGMEPDQKSAPSPGGSPGSR